MFILFWTAGPLQALDSVTLQLKWLHAFQFAGYYAAKEKGYYQEAGLKVEIVEPTMGVDPMINVLDGKAEFGVGDSSLLLMHHKGEPLVVIGVIFQHSALVLVTLDQGSTQSIHDLAGKSLMMMDHDAELHAYLQKVGLKPEDYTVEPNSFNIQDLIDRKTDAFSSYITDQTYTLTQQKIPFVAYSPRSEGIDFYGDNLYTTEDQLEQFPDRVKAFRTASLRGWVYAMENQEELIDLIYNDYSQRHDKEALRYEAEQMEKLVQPVLVEMGYMNPGRWQHIATTYADVGFLISVDWRSWFNRKKTTST